MQIAHGIKIRPRKGRKKTFMELATAINTGATAIEKCVNPIFTKKVELLLDVY